VQNLLNPGALETIGKFIGTYGLAVFLVLYYAVKLYPEMQRERGEWIRQITRLRQLVDPGTRPLTRDQAKTVMQLASDAFADRLLFTLGAREAPRGWGSSYSTDPDVVSLAVFGKELSFNSKSEMAPEKRDQELEKIGEDIARGLKEQMRGSLENLNEALKYASEMGRRDAYRLALLRFGNASLESVWIKAYDETAKQWTEGLAKTLSSYDRYGVDQVREFVGKHPSSAIAKDKIEALFAEIRFVSSQEHATRLKTIFDRQVEEELRKIDASVEEEV